MKANEFVNEMKPADSKRFEMLRSKEVLAVAQKVFSVTYPGHKLSMSEDDFIYISTSKNPSVATQWGDSGFSWDDNNDSEVNHFYLACNVSIANGELAVVIGNASAGDFKGVTSNIIQALFNKGIAAWGIPKSKVLVILQDSSGGKWEEIAEKLGVGYEEQ